MTDCLYLRYTPCHPILCITQCTCESCDFPMTYGLYSKDVFGQSCNLYDQLAFDPLSILIKHAKNLGLTQSILTGEVKLCRKYLLWYRTGRRTTCGAAIHSDVICINLVNGQGSIAMQDVSENKQKTIE